MAALTHYAKVDATVRTTTSTSAVEVTQYTVTWANLTGAGFAAGDDVLIFCQASFGASDVSANPNLGLGRGTTFAGRTILSQSISVVEPASAAVDGYHNYFYLLRHTLVVNENFYTDLTATTATTARVDDYSLIFLRLNDLTENVDFKYATVFHGVGDSASTYGTTGASVTIPAANQDWMVLASFRWLIDEINDADAYSALQVDGVDRMELRTEGEDLLETLNLGIIDALVSPANGATVRARFRTDDGTSHDAAETKIFLLRLGVFQNYGLVRSTSTITHSVVDTIVEFAGFPTFALTTTGDVGFFAQSRHVFNENTKAPGGRFRIGGAEPVTGYRRSDTVGNGAADQVAVTFALVTAQTAGTLDIDFEIFEDIDVTPSYDANEHSAVVFSLEKAGATGTLAVTQANQTSTASGVVANPVTGSVAVTQANQTSTASGSVIAGITGTVAVTQADQTSTASGLETITGAAAVTQANQTSTASGVVANPVSGTAAITQANQTSITSGTVVSNDVTGTAAVTQANQTSSALGLLVIVGSGVTVQASQIMAGTGLVNNPVSTFWEKDPVPFVKIGPADDPPWN